MFKQSCQPVPPALALVVLLRLSVFGVAAEPVAPWGCVEALRFSSEHQLICKNTTNLLTGGERYPDVAWARSPAVRVPVTHTGGDDTHVQAVLTLSLAGIEAQTPCLLEGHSQELALCFRKEVVLSPGAAVAVELTGVHPLGRAVRKINQSIRWSLTVHPRTERQRSITLGTTGPHLMYVTLGRPRDTHEPRSVVTDIRMELAVERVAAAQAKVGVTASSPWLVYELMRQNGQAYLPTRHYGRDQAWKVPESWRMEPKGASCISIVEFVILLGRMVGLEGDMNLSTFYAKPPHPRQPLRGGLGDPPITRKGPHGETWQLFLVDDTNTRKGQVGGLGGMNYYEAALEYHWRGRTYFYPGGTDRVYDTPEKVLLIFRTLAWAAYDWDLEAWVVREVVDTYSRAGEAQIPSVALPP